MQRALLAARHRNYENLSARSPDGFEQEAEEPDLAPEDAPMAAAPEGTPAAAELDEGDLLPEAGSLAGDAPDDGAASWPAAGGAAGAGELMGSAPASTAAAFMGSAGLQPSALTSTLLPFILVHGVSRACTELLAPAMNMLWLLFPISCAVGIYLRECMCLTHICRHGARAGWKGGRAKQKGGGPAAAAPDQAQAAPAAGVVASQGTSALDSRTAADWMRTRRPEAFLLSMDPPGAQASSPAESVPGAPAAGRVAVSPGTQASSAIANAPAAGPVPASAGLGRSAPAEEAAEQAPGGEPPAMSPQQEFPGAQASSAAPGAPAAGPVPALEELGTSAVGDYAAAAPAAVEETVPALEDLGTSLVGNDAALSPAAAEEMVLDAGEAMVPLAVPDGDDAAGVEDGAEGVAAAGAEHKQSDLIESAEAGASLQEDAVLDTHSAVDGETREARDVEDEGDTEQAAEAENIVAASAPLAEEPTQAAEEERPAPASAAAAVEVMLAAEGVSPDAAEEDADVADLGAELPPLQGSLAGGQQQLAEHQAAVEAESIQERAGQAAGTPQRNGSAVQGSSSPEASAAQPAPVLEPLAGSPSPSADALQEDAPVDAAREEVDMPGSPDAQDGAATGAGEAAGVSVEDDQAATGQPATAAGVAHAETAAAMPASMEQQGEEQAAALERAAGPAAAGSTSAAPSVPQRGRRSLSAPPSKKDQLEMAALRVDVRLTTLLILNPCIT